MVWEELGVAEVVDAVAADVVPPDVVVADAVVDVLVEAEEVVAIDDPTV